PCLFCSFPTRRSSDLQRWQMALVEAKYFSDEDDMVPAFVHEGGTALEACRAVVQQRDVIDAPIQLDTGELVLAARGKDKFAGIEDRKSTRLNSSHVKI